MKQMSATVLAYSLGTSLFYGLLIVVQKKGLESGLEPLEFSFARSIVVILISLLYFSPQIKCIKCLKKPDILPILLLGAVSASTVPLLFIAQDLTTAVNASFLIRLTPLFVLPVGYVVLKDRIPGDSIRSMFIMLFGTFLLITDGVFTTPGSGDLLVIIISFLIAFQNVFAKKMMGSVSPEMVIFCRVCLSSLLIVIFIPVIIDVRTVSLVQKDVFYFVITGALYFLSVFCQYNSIKLIGPFLTTAFFLSGSLFSAIFAYLLLGETLSVVQWLGVSGILAGALLLIMKSGKITNDPFWDETYIQRRWEHIRKI